MVGVRVIVGVSVNVGVGVRVGVEEGLGLEVATGPAVGLGAGSSGERLQAESSRANNTKALDLLI